MAKNSKIEWTHHTFNPWWGCTKVSPGCTHCYAQAWANRVGLEVWGAKAPRRFLSDQHWQEPLRWNREAERSRERRRVFCASMADVFEYRPELRPLRERLWDLIAATPHLDWLLLTKRPHLIGRFVPWTDDWPENVWLGTTAENQRWAAKRLPLLLRHPATVRFVSCEPLLGPVDLAPWLPGLDWVIAGGESGSGARPMNPEWAAALRDQCNDAGVAFHFKQWGHWSPNVPADRRPRQVIELSGSDGQPIHLARLSKKDAGRELDGRVWDEFPRRYA
jgi:protein gp37